MASPLIVVFALLWSVMAVIIIFLVVAIVCCKAGGNKNDTKPPQMATLSRYWKHEHLLLSIVWSGRLIKYYDRHYMNRGRRIILFVDVFLLNFIVAGIVFAASQPADVDVNCTMLHYCRAQCVSCPESGIRVGFDDLAANYEFPFASTAAYANCSRSAPDSPCFSYCNPSRRGQYYVDDRPRCADTPDNRRRDLLCLLPASVPSCTDKGLDETQSGVSVTLPTEFETKEIILRIVLTIVIVFPASALLKMLMRCTYRAEGCCSCARRSIGFILIVVILAIAVLVAIFILITFQDGELVGTVTISFLFAFFVGLILDFPKLAIIFHFWRKKKYAQRFIYCYNIYLQIQQEKAAKARKRAKKNLKGSSSARKPSRPAPKYARSRSSRSSRAAKKARRTNRI